MKNKITTNQKKIAELLCVPMSIKHIACSMNMSESAVKKNIGNMMDILNIKSRKSSEIPMALGLITKKDYNMRLTELVMKLQVDMGAACNEYVKSVSINSDSGCEISKDELSLIKEKFSNVMDTLSMIIDI